MTAIGPVLFWGLLCYFALNGLLAVLFELTDYELTQRNWAINILTAATFAVWLGIAHWAP